MLLHMLLTAAATAALVSHRIDETVCEDRCGDVVIPYPFGTTTGCFLDDNFFITCKKSSNPPQPFLWKTNILVTNITIDGRLHVMSTAGRDCYLEGGESDPISTRRVFSLSEFTISSTENMFTVIGCDSYAYIEGSISNRLYTSGCMSFCDKLDDVENGTCAGTGCCQIEIPKGLKQINYSAGSFDKHKSVLEFNQCTFAFVVEKTKFNFSSSYIWNITEKVHTVLDWTVTDHGKCENGSSSSMNYACKENAKCIVPEDGSPGYRCQCQPGYGGNPYLPNGCEESCLFEILENHIVNDGNEEQVKEVAELAKICLNVKGEERPTMREVAMELDGLRMMHKHSWVNAELNPEETERLLYDNADVYKYGDGSNTTAGYDSLKDHVLEVLDDGR
ncbi:hypothetical protein Patl1_08217 [Pistacia atlantica]|uniref:Uncharacterized protein n=1 Tax=Pistacia atlantica TaxID=434234 RepID=A0ACC1AI47_9ROSI|nr:hypothetical protein Patl1_08217 [Pistacia atlantica]